MQGTLSSVQRRHEVAAEAIPCCLAQVVVGAGGLGYWKWAAVKSGREPTEIAQQTGRYDWYDNSLGMTMMKVPEGDFEMGPGDDDSAAESNEKPRHRVSISPFWLGDREVTREQFLAIVEKDGRQTQSTGREQESELLLPAEYVTWFDAVAFCNELSEREGFGLYYELRKMEFDESDSPSSIGRSIKTAEVKVRGDLGCRLPTEAEWEYACRARSTKQFC